MDERTMAYINMYAVLGSLQELCSLSQEAQDLLKDRPPVIMALEVKDGPAMTIAFKDGRCVTREETGPCDIRLRFSTCKKFNGLINGTTTPFPSKGITKVGFLLKVFSPLTDILSTYLQPEPEKLKDTQFFVDSTTLMMNLISVAIAQIANTDSVGQFTAGNMKDGRICLSIKDGPATAIQVAANKLTAIKSRPKDYDSIMEFRDIRLARGLFDGQVSALASIGNGDIRVGGYLANIDNLNRLLDRVALYLA